MGHQSAWEPRRAPLDRFARRALVLAALGTGLWLGGQATASAEELSRPPTAVATQSSAIHAIPAARVELLPPATSPVDHAPVPTASSVARDAEPAPATVAPVAPLPVMPVVSAATPAVHSAVAPVIDLADPVVEAAEPVLEQAAPVRDVAAPVVAAVGQAVPPVADAAATLARALDPVLARVADVLDPLLGNSLIASHERPDTDFQGLDGAVQGSTAGPVSAGRVLAPAGVDVSTPGPGGAAGAPGPVRPPGTSGPAQAGGGTGASWFDQSPADVSTAVLAPITAAVAATGDARDAAANVAADPSFSPD